jgi:hypothetical protein
MTKEYLLEEKRAKLLAESRMMPKHNLPPPIIEYVTQSELEERGLTLGDKLGGKYLKVIRASQLDKSTIIITDINDIIGKYAIAPDGWYWEEFSEKCYFTIEWYELRPIPTNNQYNKDKK